MFPRRKIGQGDSVSPETDRQYQYQRCRRPCEFTYAAIAERFDRPQAEAARAFGISITTMKQICRHLSIQRWPYRRPRRATLKARPSCTPVQAELADEASHLAFLASDAASDSVIAKDPTASGAHGSGKGWHMPTLDLRSRDKDEHEQTWCKPINNAPISLLQCTGEACSSCGSMISSSSMSSICTEPDDGDMVIMDQTPILHHQTAADSANKASQDIYRRQYAWDDVSNKPSSTAPAQAAADSCKDGLSWLVPFPLSDDVTGDELEALLAWLK